MSIEHRMRKGLAANAADVSSPVEANLDTILQRHRRRVRVRLAASVAAVAVVVAAPWVALTWWDRGAEIAPTVPDEPALPGSYEVAVEGGPGTRTMTGTWTITLRDGIVEVDPPAGYNGVLPGVGEGYRVEDGELTTNLFVGWPGCQVSAPSVGRYRYDTTATGVRFELVEDTCPARVQLFDTRWERLP